MKRSLFLFCLAALAVALLPAAPPAAAAAAAPSNGAGAVARLHDLFDREWEARLKADPLMATAVGRHEYDALLPDLTVARFQEEAEEARGFLKELAAIPRAELPPAEQVNADIWKRQIEDSLADFELGIYQMPFNADSGFHSDFGQLAHDVPLDTVKDYENYTARLSAWARYVDQQIVLMRMGIARGFTVPKAVLTGYEGTITAFIVGDPTKSTFYAPFAHFPATVPEAERPRLAAA
ncbi:MAG TPA: DUF885 family protein, partial [Thermoanaerobaculia bacterium]|nr:DUF885 family protein [Thermoanaerobaculia bacterium]